MLEKRQVPVVASSTPWPKPSRDGYYLESLRDPLGQRLDLLDRARASVEGLGIGPLDDDGQAPADHGAEAEPAMPAVPEVSAQPTVEPTAAVVVTA